MRVTITKRSSTKAERVFSEILKKFHIPFKHRVKVNGREIDFVIGKYAIEIDGHPQSAVRNDWLIKEGFTPLHFTNRVILTDRENVEKSLIPKLKL